MSLKPNLESWRSDPVSLHSRYVARLGKKYRDKEEEVLKIKRNFPFIWIFLPSFWAAREDMKDAKWWYETELQKTLI